MPGSKKRPILVFTDLDGSLLDHDTYSWDAARPALDVLRLRGIPLVLNSSKTSSEILDLRSALGNDDPFVVENGSAIAIPPGYFDRDGESDGEISTVVFGAHYGEIRHALTDLRMQHGYRFRGFGDMGIDELAELTGLGREAAQRARQRASSEPLLWEDDDARLEDFRDRLHQRGLYLVRGGRFHHVSAGNDKGQAVHWLTRRFHDYLGGESPLTIGLGDGPNDRPMLEAVDYPVIIRARHQMEFELRNRARLYRTRKYGPAGWNEAILKLLADLA